MSFLTRWLPRGLSSSPLGEPPQDPIVAQNIRYLYIEIAFAAVLGAVITFHPTFVVRLGGSKELVALLTAVPALVAAVFSIPTARFLQSRVNRRRWIFGSLLVTRIGHGLVAVIPILFPEHAASWFVAWVILLNLPGILFLNGFQAMLADLIPERQRATVFSYRQVIWSFFSVGTSILAGQWLQQTPFPINYQLMFLIGFLASLISQYFVTRVVTVAVKPAAASNAPAPPESRPLPQRRARLTAPIRRMLFNMGVYTFGLTTAGPLFIIYYIETLHATDDWIGLNTGIGFVGIIGGNLLWARLLRRHSYTWVLRRATLLTWLFPITIALFPNLTVVLIIGLLISMIHPGVELASLNIMLKLGGVENRAVIMSWYNAVINASMFIAPLVGTWLANYVGIPGVLVMAGAVRILGGLLMTFNPVQEPSRDAGALATQTQEMVKADELKES